MKDRELIKLYLCIAVGNFEKKADTMTAYLEKMKNKIVYISAINLVMVQRQLRQNIVFFLKGMV